MNDNEWEQVETIFHTALNLSGKQRVSYLSEACCGNEPLLSEVNSLIFAFEHESDFLEKPPISLGLVALKSKDEKNLSGQTIGFYRVREKLGGGGMGDVYLAEDTRLNRQVALKFLKDTLLNNQWAKRQFTREAQAVAILEHPNICVVHSIEEVDGHNFIVMQYIEGQPLTEYIKDREIDDAEALKITLQIAKALSTAHSHSIIHRDIKPGNIIITPDGKLKVLDFGLAKIIQQKQKQHEDDNSSHISNNGLILGTVSYMSPEQLRGEKLDFRSDIFSFGIIIYELLFKKNPFSRKSQAETIAAILADAPELNSSKSTKTCAALEFIARKCMNKDKEDRFHSATEILIELEKVKNGITIKPRPPVITRLTHYTSLVFILVLVLAALLFFFRQGNSIPTVAVLPIANESGQSAQNYLAVGLTENLIGKFSRISKLKVIAQPLVSKYEGLQINPQAAGKELNANIVLVGKIIKRDSALVLKASLINTVDGSALLEEEYLLEGQQLIYSQENIVSQVVAKLVPALSNEESSQITKHQTENPEAQNYYFQGRYYWSQQNGKNIRLAIDNFTTATRLDPYFAQAWSGLADSYAFYSVPSNDNPMTTDEAVKYSKFAAAKAIELDSSLCEPYSSLGMIELRYGWNWQEGEAYFKKSISLNPEYAPARYGYSLLLVVTGRFEDALIEANKAKELDPFSPNTELNVARVFYYARNFEKATQIYTELSEKYDKNLRISYGLGLIYLKNGKFKEATDIFEQIIKANKPLVAAALGYTYAKTNRKSDALQMLAELEQLSKQNYISPQENAIVYFGLNDREKAFENLQKACDEHFPALPFLLIDPLFDEFQSDPKLAELKKCANVL